MKLPLNRPSPLVFIVCSLAAMLPLAGSAQRPPAAQASKNEKANAASFTVKIAPVGIAQSALDSLNETLPNQPALAALLKGERYRHLYTEMVDSDNKADAIPDNHFRAIYYDYSGQRTIVAEGAVNHPEAVTARAETDWQPTATEEEFQEAVSVLLTDSTFSSAISSGDVATYRPMPPVSEFNADGSSIHRRIVNVGLMPNPDRKTIAHEIVGVDLASRAPVRYPGGAPLRAKTSASPNCGAQGANQATTTRNTAGQYQMTVTNQGNTLWEMLIIRPSVSSGTRASAIEVRDVKYKGHSVLKRGHVPILNVKYVNGECGPYRDWQYQEGMFATTGTDIPGSPGFRDCGTNIAQTELDNGSDTGNFRGVAVYRQGSEVVLVTELEAGWYRYISEWRFDADGTIRPRFGFGATVNSCTCLTHDHHVYFRLDIDIDGPTNSIYDIPVGARDITDNPAYLVSTEKKFIRAGNTPRFYRIRGGKRSYVLRPGGNDGSADTFAGADMWFLRYHTGATNLQAEIDDGVNITTGSAAMENLDQFLTNESLVEQDSVIWYHATVRHSPTAGSAMCTPMGEAVPPVPNTISGDSVVGPDLVPEDF